MIGRRTLAAAALAALALGGCGGGGTSTVAQRQATSTGSAPAASTTTGAPAATSKPEAHGKKHAAAPTPSATPKAKHVKPKVPAAVKRAQRIAASRQRAEIELARLCRNVNRSSLPRLPRDRAAMPRYARAVLPAAKRNASDLHKPRNPMARERVSAIASEYDALVSFLERLSQRGLSKDESQALSRPATNLVMTVSRAATGAGVPRCALPV